MTTNILNHCIQPWSNLFLRKTGRIQPCCMNSTAIGFIDKDSLGDAWNSPAIQKIRQLVSVKKYHEAGCHPNCPLIVEEKYSAKRVLPSWQKEKIHDHEYSTNIKSLLESHKGKQSIVSHYPVAFDIQPTEACNMQCFMCHQKHNDQQEVSAPKYLKLFDQLGVAHTLQFQGGEVFLDRSFPQTLINLHRRIKPFQRISVITNGTLLSHEVIINLTQGDNPIRFIVSLDTVNPATYKKIRSADLFHKVWGTLENFALIQQQKGISDIVRWNFVVMKSNLFQIKDALKKAADLEVEISFTPIIGNYPEENFFEFPEISPAGLQNYLRDCLEYASQKNIQVLKLNKIHERLERCSQTSWT